MTYQTLQILTEQDAEHYKKQGQMTLSIFENPKDLEAFKNNHKKYIEKHHKDFTACIDFIYKYMDKHLKPCLPGEFRQNNKFNRTAKEIWESKKETGCANNAIVFASLARELGYPTTLLQTLESGYVQNYLKHLSNPKEHKFPSTQLGHNFCECYINGQWVLANPTQKTTQVEYDPNNIILNRGIGINPSNPFVRPKNFIGLERGLDFGQPRSTRQQIEYLCSLTESYGNPNKSETKKQEQPTPQKSKTFKNNLITIHSPEHNNKDNQTTQNKQISSPKSQEEDGLVLKPSWMNSPPNKK